LDLYLENKLDMDRYERRLAQIRHTRKTAEDELARQKAKADHVEQLERDREALLNHFARIVPEQLHALEPEERNRIYKMLDLTVLAHENGSLELKWTLGADPCRDNEPPPRWSFAYTTPAFRFRAILTAEAHEVELALV
jgi:hypothetical protein